LRILVLNWRDLKNPAAGGAEVYTHQIMKRLAKQHEITQFSAYFPGAKKDETIDGVRIVRGGNALTVYLHAFLFYCFGLKKKPDVVIDECNTLPFFTPFYVRKPAKRVFLIHQLAVEFWDYEVLWPFSKVGKFFEPLLLRLYRNEKTITVSNSTKQDLLALGFKDVSIVENGLDMPVCKSVPRKFKDPTVLFVGRLKRAKGPQIAVEAMIEAKKRIPNLQGYVVGDGYMRKELEQKIRKARASGYIRLTGFLPKHEVTALMKKSHVLVVPSIREGWGQVVIQANACGTPAVGFDVPGLRDSICDNLTGLLVNSNGAVSLSNKIIILFFKKKRFDKITKNTLKWAQKFNWEKSSLKLNRLILSSPV